MRTILGNAIFIFLILAVTGCAKPKATCAGQQEISLVNQIIFDGAEKYLSEVNEQSGKSVFDPAVVKATLSKIVIVVENVRTIKEDPNSTKVFCAGSMKITVPQEILTDAEQGRKLMELGSLSVGAKAIDLDQSANSFAKSIEYNVQPTDDGKSLFAELIGATKVSEFLGEIVGSSMGKTIIGNKKNPQSKVDERKTDQQASMTENLESVPQFKKGENYSNVRKKMIDAGWMPFHSPNADDCGSDSRCKDRPEMESCAGSGMANCRFLWQKSRKTVGICTVGEDAEFDSVCSD